MCFFLFFFSFSSDNTDRVWPAGVLCATALPGLWLAEDEVGGQPANPPHPCRSKWATTPPPVLLSALETPNLHSLLCFSSFLLLLLRPSSSPAIAREVRDEGRGRPLLGGVCGDQDESSGQVPEANCRPSCPLLQPTPKRFPVCQGKTMQRWEVRGFFAFYKNSCP